MAAPATVSDPTEAEAAAARNTVRYLFVLHVSLIWRSARIYALFARSLDAALDETRRRRCNLVSVLDAYREMYVSRSNTAAEAAGAVGARTGDNLSSSIAILQC